MYDIPLIETKPGRIILKYAKDAAGKPLVITYDPAISTDRPKAFGVAKQLEQRAIAGWEKSLGRPLTYKEFYSGAVAHQPLSMKEEIAKQSKLSQPVLDANPAATHLAWLLRNPGTTPGERTQRKKEIKRIEALAKEFDARNGARRIEAELAQEVAKKGLENTPLNRAKIHSLKTWDKLKMNERATQADVDAAYERAGRLTKAEDATAYWAEFGVWNTGWEARIKNAIQPLVDKAVELEQSAMKIEEQNTLEAKKTDNTITLPESINSK